MREWNTLFFRKPYHNAPWMVGSIAFGVTVLSALAAFSARETYRVHLNDLGQLDAAPVDERTYLSLRRGSA